MAWLTKDIDAPFDERPDVDLGKLDKARQIWEKPVETQSTSVENTYEDNIDNRNIDEHEFAPEVSSTPVKAGRRNQSTPCTPEKVMDDNCAGQDQSINVEEFVEEYLNDNNLEDNHEVQENEEDSQWQNESTECDVCNFRGRIANHLRSSPGCLKELRSRPSLRMKGSDAMFILKTSLIIGECPSPNCRRSCQKEIPQECVAWWKSEGWDMLGWKGDKANADAKLILQKIQTMLVNRRKRRCQEEVTEGSQRTHNTTKNPNISSGCRSCGYQGGLMEHLSERQDCFEEHVKHYITKEQPEDSSDDYLRRKLMLELSAVLNTCARMQCSTRRDVEYLGTHLAASSQCLQHYQHEGVYLSLPNWKPEDSSRIISRRVSQMRRRINESKTREDSRGYSSFKKEIGNLLSHVCFKCRTMGPVLEEELSQMTCAGIDDSDTMQWRCALCTAQSPPFDEVSLKLKEEGQRLRSSDFHQERALKAVTSPGSNKVIFAPSILAEANADVQYIAPTFSSVVLLPSEPPALRMLKNMFDQALQQKVSLDNYVQELLKRPVIIDFEDFLSCLYRSMMASVRAFMDRIFKAISTVARGEVLSWNPNTTNANKRTPNLDMTLKGALEEVPLSSLILVFIEMFTGVQMVSPTSAQEIQSKCS